MAGTRGGEKGTDPVTMTGLQGVLRRPWLVAVPTLASSACMTAVTLSNRQTGSVVVGRGISPRNSYPMGSSSMATAVSLSTWKSKPCAVTGDGSSWDRKSFSSPHGGSRTRWGAAPTTASQIGQLAISPTDASALLAKVCRLCNGFDWAEEPVSDMPIVT